MRKTPFIPKTPGQRLAHARRLLGVYEGEDVSVPDLAKLLDVSKESVYGWEADAATPRDPMLARIAKTLRVTEAWVKYGITSPEPTAPDAGHVVAQPIIHRDGGTKKNATRKQGGGKG